MSWTSSLASWLGGSEDGLVFLLGQLMGYPVMLVYRLFLYKRSSTAQHIYFLLTGLLVGLWTIGMDVIHNLYAVMGTYLILLFAGGTLASVVISFLFNMGYLLIGYWYTESEGYDICWTMPHCVLCLRLIGLTFDCYDGARASVEGEVILSKDQKLTALKTKPGILQMFSHAFFIGTYHAGPLVPFKKYSEFATSKYQEDLPKSPVPFGLKRLGLSVMYMAIHLYGSSWLPSDWPNSLDFYSTGLAMKLMKLCIWCRIVLYKYLTVWLVSEGVCIMSGLSFNGVKEDGKVDFTGCANVKLTRLETASQFSHLVSSFNINTNAWVAAYIYKRLKFMNNRVISQVVTLLFLAMWHGYHTGYFLTFFNEFITINFEKSFLSTLQRSERFEQWMHHPFADIVVKLFGWVWVTVFMAQCFIPFALLTADRFIPSYMGIYFLLYAVYLTWPLWMVPVKAFLKVKSRRD